MTDHETMVRTARLLRSTMVGFNMDRDIQNIYEINYKPLVQYMIHLEIRPEDLDAENMANIVKALSLMEKPPRVTIVDPWWRVLDFASEFPHKPFCKCCVAAGVCWQCAGDLEIDRSCVCSPAIKKSPLPGTHSDGGYR